ncbi:hypothetical protein [Flammeovirga sp. OC4]|uniref:hypothetical protein n=1 Tax=Flammeovirga sp. OC4 TaxID=1382345 RepID=UPI0005C716A5|nr:hypothetical protein [Flammeovirga sp. OC4]
MRLQKAIMKLNSFIIILIINFYSPLHCNAQEADNECEIEYDTVFKMNTIIGSIKNTPIKGKDYLIKEIAKRVKIDSELARKLNFGDFKIYFILLINKTGIVEKSLILEHKSRGINFIKNKAELESFMKTEQWNVSSCSKNMYPTTVLFPIAFHLRI